MRALLSCLAAAFLAMAALPALADEPQQSSPFTAAEREALHAEIRAYLLENPEVLQEMIQLLEQKQQAATAENDRTLVAMHAEEIFDDGFSWVGGNPEGQLHRGRVPRLPVRLLQAGAAGRGGAPRAPTATSG